VSLLFDAIVVAGGQGTRIGGTAPGDKAFVELAGRPLLEHVLEAVADAQRVVCVGANLPTVLPGEPLRCVEQPVGAGPLAAVAAGLAHVSGDVVLVVAADTPFVGEALGALQAALGASAADAVVLTDGAGRRHYLAAMWRTKSLWAALSTLGDVSGRSMRSLYDLEQLCVLPVFDATDAAFDVDTPRDLAAAERRRAAATNLPR